MRIEGCILMYSGMPSVKALSLTHDSLHGASIEL